MYQEQEHGQSPEEDELALLRHQQALRRRLRSGGPVVFTFSTSHGPQIFHGRHRTALAWEPAKSGALWDSRCMAFNHH
jgi:hypothetical protein